MSTNFHNHLYRLIMIFTSSVWNAAWYSSQYCFPFKRRNASCFYLIRECNRLPPKVRSLKRSLIGREEDDCSVIMRLLSGSGAAHEAVGKKEHCEKSWRDNSTGGWTGTRTAGGGGKTGISYSGVTRRIIRRESRNCIKTATRFPLTDFLLPALKCWARDLVAD